MSNQDIQKSIGRAALSATQPAQAAQSTHWTENEPVRLAPSRVGRVYVAGPMTGIADFNFPAFNAEAARLRGDGLAVLNPAEHGIVDGAEWADYLRHDIAGLASCERIHLLRGWSNSKGARLEVTIAQALGMAITYQEGAEEAQAAQGEPTDQEASKWCAYVGGMVACWLQMSPEAVAHMSDEGMSKTIAGIIERRLWALRRDTAPAQPAAGADVEPEHVTLLNEKVRELEVRDAFEAQNKCSLGFKRSARGTYVNPPVARDWKWFQLGIQHANKETA